MRKDLTILSFLLGGMFAACGAELPPRLAIVSENPDLAPVLDMLTVQLSKEQGLVLLERAQIDKAYSEQALSSGSHDYLKLGQVLGADGLLVMTLLKDREPELFSIRLLAAKPGVILRESQYPWPITDLIGWSSLVKQQFQPYFPKLQVLTKDALPVSVVSLRSALSSPASEALERELTLLLHSRLIKERAIFVLERRRLQSLTEEKEIQPTNETPFWSGSYLLDGTINKEGFSTNTVTLNVRLRAPGGKEVSAHEVVGPLTNLAAVVNDLSLRILSVIKSAPGTGGWDALAEADQYLNEAKWMLKWRLFKEARDAADSAWALGRQTRDVAELRIKCWRESAAFPLDNRFVGHVLVAGDRAQQEQQFVAMAHTLQLFSESFRVFVASEPKLDPAWFQLGATLLDQGSKWLRHFYFALEARIGQEQRLSDVRQLLCEITAMIERHRGLPGADPKAILLKTKAQHLAFWYQTPEEGVRAYRQILAAGQWPLVRGRFLNAAEMERTLDRFADTPSSEAFAARQEPRADAANPCLAGWKWEDRARWSEVWRSFIEELCTSTNSLVALEGRLLRCSFAWSGAEFERELNRLLQEILKRRDSIRQAGLEAQLFIDLPFMFNLRAEALVTEERKRLKTQVFDPFVIDYTQSPPPPPAVEQSVKLPSRPPDPKPAMPTGPPALTPGSNRLEVSRFWRIPQAIAAPTPDIGCAPFISDCCYRDSSLWVEIRYAQSSQNLERCDFYDVDLATFQARRISYTNATYRLLARRTGEQGGRLFDVHNGWLYLAVESGIARCALGTQRWETFPVPSAAQAFPVRLGDRLFFLSTDSILEYNADGTFRLLAGARRQPPENLLDQVGNYRDGRLLLGPQGSLRAAVQGKLYLLPLGSRDWRDLGPMPAAGSATKYSFSDDILFISSVPFSVSGQLWVLPPASDAFRLLFVQPPPSPARASAGTLNKVMLPGPAWPLPKAVHMANYPACMLGDCFWFLIGDLDYRTNPAGNLLMTLNKAEHASLMCFSYAEKDPARIPLVFSSEHAILPNRSWDSPWRPRDRPWPLFYPTPKGLVVSRPFIQGFWLLPEPDLQRCVSAARRQQLDEKMTLTRNHEQWRREILASYDRNANGVIDLHERAAAFADPHFVELESPNIDANRNGLLDPAELAYFGLQPTPAVDLKGNQAVELTLQFLARKLFEELDGYQEGKVDCADLPEPILRLRLSWPSPRDVRRNPTLTQEELLNLVREYLDRMLRAPPVLSSSPGTSSVPVQARPTSSPNKAAVGP